MQLDLKIDERDLSEQELTKWLLSWAKEERRYEILASRFLQIIEEARQFFKIIEYPKCFLAISHNDAKIIEKFFVNKGDFFQSYKNMVAEEGDDEETLAIKKSLKTWYANGVIGVMGGDLLLYSDSNLKIGEYKFLTGVEVMTIASAKPAPVARKKKEFDRSEEASIIY